MYHTSVTINRHIRRLWSAFDWKTSFVVVDDNDGDDDDDDDN